MLLGEQSAANGINIYVNLSYKTAKHRCHINAFVAFENSAKSNGTRNVVTDRDSKRCSIQIDASQHCREGSAYFFWRMQLRKC